MKNRLLLLLASLREINSHNSSIIETEKLIVWKHLKDYLTLLMQESDPWIFFFPASSQRCKSILILL